MRTIFIGGPGRSGTSFVADRLGRHPEVGAFADIELKFFTEKGGLLDLHHSLTDRYSPNRAGVALAQFNRLVDSLIHGQFGQPAFATLAPEEAWRSIFERFTGGLCENGLPIRSTDRAFFLLARRLVGDLGALSASLPDQSREVTFFLEKTPHALLAIEFLDAISPGSHFIHVMRDPRSIAASLRTVRWGPADLDACCAWVAQYCEAWLETEATAARLGLQINRLAIEDIARAPQAHARALCDGIGVAPDTALFAHCSLDVLNGWASRIDADERRQLDERLAGWIHHFEYAMDAVGTRLRDRATAQPIDVAGESAASGTAATLGAEAAPDPSSDHPVDVDRDARARCDYTDDAEGKVSEDPKGAPEGPAANEAA